MCKELAFREGSLAKEEIEELIQKAQEAYQRSYVPYSHYPVGAAALFSEVFSGCNVENASFGLTLCAERNAIFRGIAAGERSLRAVAVAVPGEAFPSPCGACRQVMREFAEDCPVILINGQGKTKYISLKELLPESFGPDSL
ncbi:cytidine deaminase [Peptococcaceae bacterium CEB3]|nr:cytidine deaminase [Peptococcaceae bacterium CEB3]